MFRAAKRDKHIKQVDNVWVALDATVYVQLSGKLHTVVWFCGNALLRSEDCRALRHRPAFLLHPVHLAKGSGAQLLPPSVLLLELAILAAALQRQSPLGILKLRQTSNGSDARRHDALLAPRDRLPSLLLKLTAACHTVLLSRIRRTPLGCFGHPPGRDDASNLQTSVRERVVIKRAGLFDQLRLQTL
jgi:hypothetical protein